jgi:hypothetical protein
MTGITAAVDRAIRTALVRWTERVSILSPATATSPREAGSGATPVDHRVAPQTFEVR